MTFDKKVLMVDWDENLIKNVADYVPTRGYLIVPEEPKSAQELKDIMQSFPLACVCREYLHRNKFDIGQVCDAIGSYDGRFIMASGLDIDRASDRDEINYDMHPIYWLKKPFRQHELLNALHL